MSPEEQFVRAFVRKDRRRRYLALVSTVKGREKFREALAHRLEVELENVQPIPPRMQSPAAIAETLRGLGAPKLCYIISESRDPWPLLKQTPTENWASVSPLRAA
jgi:DNA-binding MarR family transcriptional regulator